MIAPTNQGGFSRADVDALLAENRELKAINRDLEVVAYAIAHDLRAPLRTIDGYTELLAEDLTAVSDPVARDLAGIQSTVERMHSMLLQWLSLIHKHRVELVAEPVDLSSLAESVIRDLRISDPHRDVSVSIQPNLSAYGDAGLLRELLQNLLGNAWKFTQGRVSPRIDVGAYRDRDDLVFFVRDNGIGFNEQDRHRLFEPFVRLHSDQPFTGSGVGLAIAQRIVERHHGRIWATGLPNVGATFKFILNSLQS